MSSTARRRAARANQRAAAFVRFQQLGDHEAMHLVLLEVGEEEASDPTARLAFVTALASIAGSMATAAFGAEQASARLQAIAQASASISDADDIDGYFEPR